MSKLAEVDGTPRAAVAEAPFRASTPDDRWTVEVRQVSGPAADGNDWFTGTVTLDGTTIIETLTTSDTHKLILWAQKQMQEAMRRSKAL